MKKYVICYNTAKFFTKEQDSVINLYKKTRCNIFYKCIRKIFLFLGFIPRYWLNTWFKDFQDDDIIILFEVRSAPYIIKCIREKSKKVRIILWLWNTVDENKDTFNMVQKVNRSSCEIWSYNLGDCKKYNFFYNTQFYCLPVKSNTNQNALQQEVYYLGNDKNRTHILEKLQEIFIKNNISYKFLLVKYKNSIEGKIKYSKPISYDENISNVINSKSILDLVDRDKVIGNTLRPFEAEYFHKKLITNNMSVKELNFYNKNNIFILGEDDINDLPSFIASEYVFQTTCDLEYYSFNSWLNRFDNNH